MPYDPPAPNVIPITLDTIAGQIHIVRAHRVMLDADLARLYQVTTSNLNKAVARNRERFPEDFMFPLTTEEAARITNLTFQSGIASSHGGRRTPPYAFTQEGVAMLSGVLHSPQAVAVNILIMRTFVRLRMAASAYHDLEHRLDALEAKTDGRFARVFAALRELLHETIEIRQHFPPPKNGPSDTSP